MEINEAGNKNEISKEKFKELAKDMKPVIQEMEKVLSKHGVECLVPFTRAEFY